MCRRERRGTRGRGKKAPAARSANPRTWYMTINATDYERFVREDATGPPKFVKIDVVDSVKFVNIVMTGS